MPPRLGSRVVFEDVHPEDVDLRGQEKVRVIKRGGVVWSLAPGPGNVWVIPDGERSTVLVRTSTTPPRRIDGKRQVPNQAERAK